jgi:hypothetical protein
MFIRVTANDYQGWEDAHNSCRDARSEYGITDGPFYKDAADPNSALVHLVVEDMDRAMGWFKDPRFQEANARVSLAGPREIYLADRR